MTRHAAFTAILAMLVAVLADRVRELENRKPCSCQRESVEVRPELLLEVKGGEW